MGPGRSAVVGPQHRLLALIAVCVLAAFALRSGAQSDRPAVPATAPAANLLPRGGKSILPEQRVVAFYGAPQAAALGVLGIGPPSTAAQGLTQLARRYSRPRRPVLPAFELIGVIANAGPGADGLYRTRQSTATIDRYLAEARRNNFLLLIDIQPGRSTFMREVLALRPYLEQPDVGLALDPEWNVGPDGVPGKVIGHVRAAEINAVTAYLSRLVRMRSLPEKLLVIHQFTETMVRGDNSLRSPPGVDIVLNADGFGTAELKTGVYGRLAPAGGPFFRGFKLFFEEDTGLISPRNVLRLRPGPVDLVIYE